MSGDEAIQELIDEIKFRKSNSKDYARMKAGEIGIEFREILKFEQEAFKKIEEFEKGQENSDLVEYAKMIFSNTVAREISQIQEVYLRKIGDEYIN